MKEDISRKGNYRAKKEGGVGEEGFIKARQRRKQTRALEGEHTSISFAS